MTLRKALLDATARLERHFVSSPRLNAEVLLSHCLKVDKTYLYTHDERELTPAELQAFEDVLYDRISGVPVQYIVGRQEFYGRYFTVNRSVLIPRPETENIIEMVLGLRPNPGAAILDVGTGSGCIGITLALELAEARVTVTDISFDALRVAKANALALGADVGVVCMDLVDAAGGPFDIIVSNPPYVSPGELTRLQREVREHEPHVALFAQDDGLAAFRNLIPGAKRTLRQGGYLIVEIGFGMAARVGGLFGAGWERLPDKPDLQGIPRTLIARKG